MKDKRQRLSLAWPVADPMFAAYLLQAAGYAYPLAHMAPPAVTSMAPGGCYSPAVSSALGVSARYSPYGPLGAPLRPHPAGIAALHPAFASPLCPTGAMNGAGRYSAAMSAMGHLSPPVLPLSLKMPLTPPTGSPPANQVTSSPKMAATSPSSSVTSSSSDHLHFNFPAASAAASASPPARSSSAAAPRLFQPYKLDVDDDKSPRS